MFETAVSPVLTGSAFGQRKYCKSHEMALRCIYGVLSTDLENRHLVKLVLADEKNTNNGRYVISSTSAQYYCNQFLTNI